jgi:hypothetical protein
MATRPRTAPEADLDRAFIEAERNRFAGRALSFLIVLNGAAALILLFVMARRNQASMSTNASPTSIGLAST